MVGFQVFLLPHLLDGTSFSQHDFANSDPANLAKYTTNPAWLAQATICWDGSSSVVQSGIAETKVEPKKAMVSGW